METAFDSLMKRFTETSSRAISSFSILTATMRRIRRSSARKTTAMPPMPIILSILYLLSSTCPTYLS